MLDRLTLNDFEKLLGLEHIHTVGPDRAVKVVLSEARSLGVAPLGDATRSPFSLVFDALESGRIEQRTYTLTFPDGASTDIFLVPIGLTPDGGTRLQAIFT